MTHEASRKALQAHVSNGAHDRWHGFAAEQGVSVSAILEALAPQLTVGSHVPRDTCDGADLVHVVGQARRIDAKRRRRRR